MASNTRASSGIDMLGPAFLSEPLVQIERPSLCSTVRFSAMRAGATGAAVGAIWALVLPLLTCFVILTIDYQLEAEFFASVFFFLLLTTTYLVPVSALVGWVIGAGIGATAPVMQVALGRTVTRLVGTAASSAPLLFTWSIWTMIFDDVGSVAWSRSIPLAATVACFFLMGTHLHNVSEFRAS